MRVWLDFAEGPLFRFAFAVMVLGLLRLVAISIFELYRMKQRTPDKTTDIGGSIVGAFKWLFSFVIPTKGNPEAETRPLYMATSILFHIGLIAVPIFFLPHITLWRGGIGFGWPGLPSLVADGLTIATVATGVALVAMRVANRGSRALSKTQDWILTPLCVLVFVTGFLAAHPMNNPFGYNATRLVHVVLGDVILLSMPFTKLAHVVLLPFTHALTDLSWKFVPGVGEKVRVALGQQDKPI
jgi:nitrate reductase gamma subunit